MSELAELRQRIAELEASEAGRRQAEKMLRESELKYRAMFEASTDAIFLETLDGQVLDCNRAACEMLGYTREECLRLTAADLVPPDIAATLRDVIAPQLTTGGVFVKTFNKRKNGEVFPVEVSAQVAMVEGDPRVITYVRDITNHERATEALTRRMQELAALYETSLEINAQPELSKLLPAIVERAARLIGAPMAGLYLLRPAEGGEVLELVVSHNLMRDYTGTLLHLGEGLSGRIAQTGETMVVENHREWDGRANAYADSPARRVLGVPLKIENRVIGVINVADTERAGPYSEEEIRSVTLLANQAAIAIRNAQLYEASRSELAERRRAEQDIRRLNQDLVHRATELTALNQAGRSMASTLDMDALLSLILEQVKAMLDAQAAAVVVPAPTLDEAGHAQDAQDARAELVCAAANGPAGDRLTGMRFAAADSLAGWAIREKQSVLVADAQRDSRCQIVQRMNEMLGVPTRSYLATPLMVAGQAAGVVVAVNKSTGAFDEHDQAVLEVLCGSAAIALDNARLLAEARRRAGQLTLLYDAGLVLNRTLDPREQLEALSRIAMQALRAENSGFFRYDAARNEVYYEFGVGRGVDLDVARELRAPLGTERGLVGWIAQNRAPFYLPDVTADPRWIVTDPEIRSAFWVPVQHEDQLLGLLSVASTRVNAFTPDDQRLLALFANQVASSLENARLYQAALEAAERRTILHWLSQEIVGAGPDPARINAAVHQAVARLMPAEVFVIALLDEARGEIDLAYRVDRDKHYPSQHVPRDSGLSGRIIASGQPVLVSDVEQDSHDFGGVHFGDPPFVRSILAVPMRAGNRVLGTLSAQSYRPHAYTAEDSPLLEMLAAYAAIALENARFYAVEQERTTALANALARQRQLDLLQREFIQNVSHELRTPLAIIQGHAEMLDSGWLGDLPPGQRRSVGVIARRTQMLTKLVDNITFLIDNEQRELVREPVDLAQLVRGVLADYQASAENADLILSAEGEPDLPRVAGDAIALRRVIDHVIGNALKFTPAGGRVTARLSHDEHTVVLRISDTGVGIPADQLERVFERFYQVDGSTTRRYGGVGLGLALAQQVVQAHGGQITVASEMDVGTTFTIRLPAL